MSRNAKTEKEGEFEKSKTRKIYEKPKTLILDYNRMKEDTIVSWLWIKPGFDLNACRTVNILPVENYTTVDYKWAQAELTRELKKVFTPNQSKTGNMNLVISTAIIDLVPKTKIFNKQVIPKISVEIIIFDEDTKIVCCKISHYNKAEEFKDALKGLVSDLKTLSNKTLRK